MSPQYHDFFSNLPISGGIITALYADFAGQNSISKTDINREFYKITYVQN